jgi:hypothetical protein
MDRFWQKVEKTETCWNWTACAHPKGYGLFSIRNRNRRAHRVSYEMHCGPITDGMQVLHECDNPRCVRPDHLFLGTNADNMADKCAKGREAHVGQKGEANARAKLTTEKVLAIRAAVGTQDEIAASFGISRGAVSGIRTGRRWSHVTAGERHAG